MIREFTSKTLVGLMRDIVIYIDRYKEDYRCLDSEFRIHIDNKPGCDGKYRATIIDVENTNDR